MEEINYIHYKEMHNTIAAEQILPFVFEIHNPKSIIDIGCGNGSWLKAANLMGVKEIMGVDGIQVNNEQMHILENQFLKHDLTQEINLNKKYDLAICLEVAEHLPPAAADTIVKNITNHSDFVLFSAAIPGQGGQYHFNEQWPEYWHKKFRDNGFFAYDIIRNEFWNNENVFWWYKQNIIVFAKKGILDENKYKKSDEINAIIHPELYRKKEFSPKYIDKKGKLNLIFKSIKSLLKS